MLFTSVAFVQFICKVQIKHKQKFTQEFDQFPTLNFLRNRNEMRILIMIRIRHEGKKEY